MNMCGAPGSVSTVLAELFASIDERETTPGGDVFTEGVKRIGAFDFGLFC